MAHYLIDRMDERPAVNELVCSCGVPIVPDCDVSKMSINEEWDRHLAEVGEI